MRVEARIADVIRDATRPELGDLTVEHYHGAPDATPGDVRCVDAKGAAVLVRGTDVVMVRPWANPFMVGDRITVPGVKVEGVITEMPAVLPGINWVMQDYGRLDGGCMVNLRTARLMERAVSEPTRQLALL